MKELRTLDRYFNLRSAAAAILFALLGSLALALPAAPPTVGWTIDCKLSHEAMEDPIVFPGQPGASHLHDFFGNTTTDAFSTYESLVQGGTTCERADDTAAYWAPTLYFEGSPIGYRENEIDFYYRSRTYPLSDVQPFPAGLRVIAGSPHATGPQSTKAVDWDCADGGPDLDTNHPVDCGAGYVSADIKFPDCWDGVHLDSTDHKSHMAYATKGEDGRFRCPATHPVPVPTLKFSVDWNVHDGTRISLASGPYYTLHADFINSWQPGTLEALVAQCINPGVNCGKLK